MNKKVSFFLFLLIVLTEETEEFLKFRNSRQAISKLSKISSNHMKLARLANGIYIQKGLLDGTLSVDDVVVGIWNLKDKKVLEQLKGFPVANLTAHLTAMDRALKRVPDGLKEVDVADVVTKMQPVDEVKPAIESVKAAVKMEKYPKLITSVFHFSDIKTGHDKLSSGATALTAIEGKNNATDEELDSAELWTGEAGSAAMTINRLRGGMKEFLEQAKDDKTLLEFKTSIPLVRTYLTQKTELAALRDALTTAGTYFDSLKAFFAPTAGITDFRKIIEDARKSLESLRDTASPSNPVGIAFQDTRSLNGVFDDLNSPWLKTVLNKGNPLQKFIDALKPLSNFSKGFSAISSALENMESDKIPAAIKLLDTFLDRVEAVGAVSAKVSSLAKFKDCFPQTLPTEPADSTEIETLSEQLNGVSAQLNSVYTLLKDLEEKKYDELSIKLRNSIEAHKADKTKLIDATLLKDLKTKFTAYSEASKLAAEEINKHPAFAQYKHVDKAKSKIEEVKKWFKETNLADSSKCDLQSMDTSVLSGLNDLIKVVNEVKQKKPLARVSVISSEVSNLVTGIQKLSGFKKGGGDKSDALSLNFVAANPSSKLLDLASGITNLHRMSQVHAAKTTDLQKVIGAGPIVQVAIQSVRDANDKASLTTTWNGFPAVVATLTAFSAKLDELENKLQVTQEKSLADVAKTYQTASQLQTTGKINLKPFTKSFLLIDPADQGIKDLETSFKAIDTPVSQDLSLSFASFGSPLSNALNYFGKQVGAFQGPKTGGSASQQSSGQSAGGQGPNLMMIGAGVGVLIAIAIGVALFFFCCCVKRKFVPGKKYSMTKAKGTGPEEEPFKPNVENNTEWTHSYIRLQDVRLEMNKMDKEKHTKLYKAVTTRDWKTTRELLDKGALVDVPCGKMMRTALHELVLMKDHEHAEWLCERGAWIMQPDAHGEFPDTWGNAFGFHDLFNKYFPVPKKRLIPPNTPRPFNILVMNPHAISLWKRRKIPARVKDKITWGYNYDKSIDLNQYTHIVIPPYFCADNTTLALDNEDLFRYKLVACLGILMHEDWLDAMIANEDCIGNEEEFLIFHMKYNGIHNADALFKLKTDLHMGRPKFLAQTRITILDTKNEKQASKKKEWEEIIELFGGKVYKVPVPDVDETTMPYNTLYSQSNKNSQNGCWILRFDDSTINPIWRSDMEAYTLVAFNFLPHSIAQFSILPACNEVYPLEYDKKPKTENKKPKTQRSMMSDESRKNKPTTPSAVPDNATEKKTEKTTDKETKSNATDSKTPDTETQKTKK